MEETRPVLHVRQRVNRKEAAVLARAVASNSAKEALFGIHQHLALTKANNATLSAKRPTTIKAGFPFKDPTTLYVAGKRMKLASKGQESEWAVFAMNILFCGHPMGFQGMVLESDDPFGGEGANGSNGGTIPPRFTPLIEDEEDEYEVDDLPADQRMRRLAVRSYTNQFGGFDGLRFEHRRPESTRSGGRPSANVDVPVEGFTLGDGSYSTMA
jgi:hypothetical protein